MPCLVNGSELLLSGDVGASMDWWTGENMGFSSADVIMALAQMGDNNAITVRINSGGGIAWEGSAIHSALARHKGQVTVLVEGIAASAASVIAMAGDEIVMALGAMLMVHEASGYTIGTVREHQEQINCLTALNSSIASIYAAKSGRALGDCLSDMAEETWMTADRAVSLGYANRIEGTVAVSDDGSGIVTPLPSAKAMTEPSAFPYRAYRHAPANILALADRNNWPHQLPRAVIPAPSTAKERATMSKPAVPLVSVTTDTAALAVEAKSNQKESTLPVTDNPVSVGSAAFNRADAAEIAEICAAGGAPSMTASLIREGVSAETARERVNAAGQIREVVALARKNAPSLPSNFADVAIASGKSVADIKAQLFDAMAGASEQAPIQHQHLAGAGSYHQSADALNDGRKKSKENMEKLLKHNRMT